LIGLVPLGQKHPTYDQDAREKRKDLRPMYLLQGTPSMTGRPFIGSTSSLFYQFSIAPQTGDQDFITSAFEGHSSKPFQGPRKKNKSM
jgi:hypothetical protein